MEVPAGVAWGILFCGVFFCAAFLYWRHVWFFRNPDRTITGGRNLVSPADGSVVYAKRISPGEPVLSMKSNRTIALSDILQADFEGDKALIGIFMSPFSVHYNRAPLTGTVRYQRHYPATIKNLHMGSMHWRSLLRKLPIYVNSPHIVENERTVTRLDGEISGKPVSCYVVQIAGGSVNGIDSYVGVGQVVQKGSIFGMIRIGSQVDMVVNWCDGMEVNVKPGDRVFAGESTLITFSDSSENRKT